MEEKYLMVFFEKSPTPYAYCRGILDEKNIPYDYELVEVNEAYEGMVGLKASAVTGKRFEEIFPTEDWVDASNWYEALKEVLINKKSVDVDMEYNWMNKLLKVSIIPINGSYFACIFREVSIRRPEGPAQSDNKCTYAAVGDNSAEEKLVKYQKLLQEKNQLIESILDNAPIGIWLSDKEPGSIFINKFVKENFDLTEEEAAFSNKTDQDAFKNDNPQYNEEIITFQDNKKHILRTVKTKVYNEDESVLGILGIGMDITERKEAADALRKSEEKYRLIAENTSDVIWVLNVTQNMFTYVSPCVKDLTGYTAEETIARGLKEILTPEYKEIIDDQIVEALTEFIVNPEKSFDAFEVQIVHKNGEVIWIESSIKFRHNSQNEIEAVGVSRNIEKRKKAEKEILYLSYHDQLTGVYNRRFYQEKLIRINTEKNMPITLIMADVNGLKLTNDAFGHATGDKLLKSIAEIFNKECRAGDVIARIGGDEFVILLPKTGSLQGESIVNRISEAISRKKLDKSILSVSFGWYTKNKVEEDFDEIYKKAEDFMYHRKLLESTSVKNDIIKLTTKTLHEKDMMEQLHSKVVSEICKKIGIALGLGPDDINELGLAGLLHDIGKIGIDERLLNKPGKFNQAEWQDMKRHPEIGYQILRSVNEFSVTAEYVLAHHERVDGKGYPRGLRGDEIPLISKIICIADSYDSMVGNYVEKAPLSIDDAVKELKANAGTQFDAEIAKVFVEKVLKKKW